MVGELTDSHKLRNQSSRSYEYTGIILLSVISSIVVVVSMLGVYGETFCSCSAFAFHTNISGGTTITNVEGLLAAIEARDHINAASQALLLDDNSTASLQLQLARQVLSKFIGSGVWNVTAAGNGTVAGNGTAVGNGTVASAGVATALSIAPPTSDRAAPPTSDRAAPPTSDRAAPPISDRAAPSTSDRAAIP
jgi:hypothetical protein